MGKRKGAENKRGGKNERKKAAGGAFAEERRQELRAAREARNESMRLQREAERDYQERIPGTNNHDLGPRATHPVLRTASSWYENITLPPPSYTPVLPKYLSDSAKRPLPVEWSTNDTPRPTKRKRNQRRRKTTQWVRRRVVVQVHWGEKYVGEHQDKRGDGDIDSFAVSFARRLQLNRGNLDLYARAPMIGEEHREIGALVHEEREVMVEEETETEEEEWENEEEGGGGYLGEDPRSDDSAPEPSSGGSMSGGMVGAVVVSVDS